MYKLLFRSHKQESGIQVEVFWIMTSCSVVGGCQQFRGPCCLHLQHWYLTSPLHGIPTQKTLTWTFTAIKTSNFSSGKWN